MGFSTINDVTAAVAERLACEASEIVDAVRDAIPGRYEDVELTDAFLREVWEAAFPDAPWPA